MKRIVISIVAVALLLFGTLALAEPTMTVKGIGIVNVEADTANVSLGVRVIANDVISAQSAVNEKVAAIIAALNDLGVGKESISTNGIGIYPNYNYDEEEKIVGYNAYNSIYITLDDVSSVGAIIDAAFAAGANSLDYVDFTARDTAEASDKALSLAVSSAKEKAQVLAEAAGVKLGEILEIRDGADSGYEYNGAYAKVAEEDAGMGAPTEVLAAGQQVSASVTITFAISGED